MTHDSYRELIQRAIDEDLSSSELALLNEHVATCAECRREWHEYKSLVFGLSNLSKVMPEKSYVGQIAAQMPPLSERQPQPEVKVVQPKRRTAGWWRGASVAAVVLLGIGLTVSGNLPGLGRDHSAAPQTKVAALPPVQQSGTDAQAVAPKTGAAKTQEGAKVAETAPATPKAALNAAPNATPQLIAKETVPDKRPAQVVAVAMGGLDAAKLDTIQSQTGVQVKPSDVHQATTVQEAQKALGTMPSAPGSENSMLVVTVDSTPTDVHVEGDKVTMTLVPDHKGTDENSEVKVFEVPKPALSQPAVLFMDDQGNPVTPHLVDLPPSPAIAGPVAKLGDLNSALQSMATLHPEQAGWATTPEAMVRHDLAELGFAPTAEVASEQRPGRVLVTQGGVSYEIALVQPFDKGAGGIWQPVSVSRVIMVDRPIERDRPIVEWAKKLGGATVESRRLLMLSEQKDGHCLVQVELEQANATEHAEVETLVYDLHLKLLADGTWTLDGAPVKR
jgi:hypothetical protein